MMGSVGELPDVWRDRRLVDMASLVQQALDNGTADLTSPVLQLVLRLRDGGVCFIRSRNQPYVLKEEARKWYVREGTKRSVALALLEETTVVGIDLSSATII